MWLWLWFWLLFVVFYYEDVKKYQNGVSGSDFWVGILIGFWYVVRRKWSPRQHMKSSLVASRLFSIFTKDRAREMSLFNTNYIYIGKLNDPAIELERLNKYFRCWRKQFCMNTSTNREKFLSNRVFVIRRFDCTILCRLFALTLLTLDFWLPFRLAHFNSKYL